MTILVLNEVRWKLATLWLNIRSFHGSMPLPTVEMDHDDYYKFTISGREEGKSARVEWEKKVQSWVDLSELEKKGKENNKIPNSPLSL